MSNREVDAAVFEEFGPSMRWDGTVADMDNHVFVMLYTDGDKRVAVLNNPKGKATVYTFHKNLN